jgi:hypothetical protein
MPSPAASFARGFDCSGVQRDVGGFPQTRPISAQPTHFPFGPRYPGPPRLKLSKQIASGCSPSVHNAFTAASSSPFNTPSQYEQAANYSGSVATAASLVSVCPSQRQTAHRGDAQANASFHARRCTRGTRGVLREVGVQPTATTTRVAASPFGFHPLHKETPYIYAHAPYCLILTAVTGHERRP